MNEMTMGLRNKVISFRENTSKIQEGIALARSTGKLDKLDEVLKAVEAMEESLSSFTLEKERRERKVVDDEEGSEKDQEYVKS